MTRTIIGIVMLLAFFFWPFYSAYREGMLRHALTGAAWTIAGLVFVGTVVYLLSGGA